MGSDAYDDLLPAKKRRGFFTDLSFQKFHPYGKGFMMRRVRLNAGSGVTVPLAVVIVFPVLILVVVLLLFILHPKSPAQILIPSAGPPAIL